MIPVKVENLSISNVGFVVFLKSEQSEKTIPIFIGGPEAQAIALRLNDVNPPRPMTHDLMKNIMDIFEARLERVIVHSLKEGTFFARLVVGFEGQTTEIDARPSDAIALALRYHAPILVTEEIMQEAGVVLDPEGKPMPATEGKEAAPDEPAEEKDRVTQLREQLDSAVKAERYEDAAKLRDEIRKATSAN